MMMPHRWMRLGMVRLIVAIVLMALCVNGLHSSLQGVLLSRGISSPSPSESRSAEYVTPTLMSTSYESGLGPDFRLYLVGSHDNITLDVGQTSNMTVDVLAVNNFTGIVHLSVEPSVALSTTVTPDNVTVPGNFRLGVTASSPGYFSVELTASSESIYHTYRVFAIASSPPASTWALGFRVILFGFLGGAIGVIGVAWAVVRRRRSQPNPPALSIGHPAFD